MGLLLVFEQINQKHFEGFMDPPVLRWNFRLRSSAGRFIPGSRKHLLDVPPVIEIASYLREEPEAEVLIADTLGHEMIHYWLWERRRPYGHTDEFWVKMCEMGVSRYNTVPRARPYRYLYRCAGCEKIYPARKRLGPLACAQCCKKHTKGRYDVRFQLYLDRSLSAAESLLGYPDKHHGNSEKLG
ncbi:SprT-like domain-containing protein [Bdellovibrionota bacterium FG-1]